MSAVIAKLGFSIVCFCSTAFIFDFVWLRLHGRPFFGFEHFVPARRLLLCFFVGVALMMLSFPEIIAVYDTCHLYALTSQP